MLGTTGVTLLSAEYLGDRLGFANRMSHDADVFTEPIALVVVGRSDGRDRSGFVQHLSAVGNDQSVAVRTQRGLMIASQARQCELGEDCNAHDGNQLTGHVHSCFS